MTIPAHELYYQFPLCCLSFGEDERVRMLSIASWCALKMGVDLGAYLDRSCLDDASEWIDQANSLQTHIDQVEAVEGRYPLVRLRHDLFRDALTGKMYYRELSVLTAVYAVLGSKKFSAISRNRIIAGSLGYKASRLMTASALASRRDQALPLTTNQVRYTLERLEERGLFVRLQISRRRVVFSNSLSLGELVDKVKGGKTKAQKRIVESRNASRKLMQDFKSMRHIKAVTNIKAVTDIKAVANIKAVAGQTNRSP